MLYHDFILQSSIPLVCAPSLVSASYPPRLLPPITSRARSPRNSAISIEPKAVGPIPVVALLRERLWGRPRCWGWWDLAVRRRDE